MPTASSLQQPITPEVIEAILADQHIRTTITKESHYWFFHLYFSQYVKYPTADFQKEIFAITEDESIKLSVLVAFRGSGKSTIITMSYPLWAILGKQQKKCVVIISQTQQQARIHFANIKRELEGNELLRADLGPFQEEAEEWGSYSLIIPRFDAKIVAVSSEQSIRGIRHGSNRPDLIICDDVEDLNSVKTRESRNRNHDWFTGEIMPLGDKNTRVLMVGNLLHEDSLLMRVKDIIDKKEISATYKEYPIYDDEKRILWPGKYQSMDEIEAERKLNTDDRNWQREYRLKIISGFDQIVKKEWIRYYDNIPVPRYKTEDEYVSTITGVDLAISEKDTADYTSMVSAHIFGHLRSEFRIYVLPNIVNERIDFPTTLKKITEIAETKHFRDIMNYIYIEDVAYQKAAVQALREQGIYGVEGVSVNGADKRARLNAITPLLQSGRILFPRYGAEDLIQQLLYFGKERHDDLVDAFVIAMTQIVTSNVRHIVIEENLWF